VSGNLTVKTQFPENGADEHRNALEFQLNGVTWCLGTGASNVSVLKTVASKRGGGRY